MASYLELIDVYDNAEFRKRVMVACVVSAEIIRAEPVNTPKHAERVVWAKDAYLDPATAAKGLVWSVLAQNKQFTTQQILGATDSALQAAVNVAIDGVV